MPLALTVLQFQLDLWLYCCSRSEFEDVTGTDKYRGDFEFCQIYKPK